MSIRDRCLSDQEAAERPPFTVWIAQWWAGRIGNERGFMMNHTDGWMGGGMWIWTVIGVLVVVLLVVVINKMSKK